MRNRWIRLSVSCLVVVVGGVLALLGSSPEAQTCTRLRPEFSVPAHNAEGLIRLVRDAVLSPGGPSEVLFFREGGSDGREVRVLTFAPDGQIDDRLLFKVPSTAHTGRTNAVSGQPSLLLAGKGRKRFSSSRPSTSTPTAGTIF